MEFDYSRLNGRMRELGETQATVAAASGMKHQTVNQKNCNHSEYKQSEILRICDALNIPYDQIHLYFFQVKKSSSQKGTAVQPDGC